jgi:hypothetical protein
MITSFINSRQKHRSKSDWMSYNPNSSTLKQWRIEKRWDFLHLEQITQHMKQHIITKNLYTLIFEKKTDCTCHGDFVHCPLDCNHTHAFCKLPTCSKEFIGTFRCEYHEKVICNNDCLPDIPCIHKVNVMYQDAMKQLATAKRVSKCSVCKQEGCRKNKCPQNPEAHIHKKRRRVTKVHVDENLEKDSENVVQLPEKNSYRDEETKNDSDNNIESNDDSDIDDNDDQCEKDIEFSDLEDEEDDKYEIDSSDEFDDNHNVYGSEIDE